MTDIAIVVERFVPTWFGFALGLTGMTPQDTAFFDNKSTKAVRVAFWRGGVVSAVFFAGLRPVALLWAQAITQIGQPV